MKKSKQLFVILLTFMFAMGLFTMASLADTGDVEVSNQGNTYTFSYESGPGTYQSATFKFAAPDKTYDGSAYNGTSAAFTPTDTEQPSFYFEPVSTTYDTSSAPKNAGTYEITKTYRVYHGNESVHSPKSVLITVKDEFEILPKQVSLYWERTASGGNDFNYEYNAQEQCPVAKVYASSLVEGDTCSVTVEGAQKNAREEGYDATAVSLSNPNYKLPTAASEISRSFWIKAKQVYVTWDKETGAITPPPSEDGPSYYYTGEAQSPLVTGATGIVEGDACEAVLDETSKRIKAGTYWAASKLTGESAGNYQNVKPNQKFYIIKKTVKAVWDEEKLTYNANLQHPAVKLAFADGSDITDEDAAKVKVKVYEDESCEQEVTGKTVVGKQYYAKAFLTEDATDFDFDESAQIAQIVKPFIIYAKPVTVTLTSNAQITYDGKYHKPEVKIEGVEEGDDCVPVESLDGKTKITMTTPDGKTNIVHIDDVNVDDEPGVYHASSGSYTAKVENTNTVDPESANYDVTKSGLKGEDARNYVLDKTATCNFVINPLPVALDWFRPAYDEYGDETEGEPVLVDVAGGERLNLVFNGKVQVPTAKIKENLLEKNPETGEPDECEITVSGPSNAIEASENPYAVSDISFSNPDYTRDQTGANYYIIAHPVKLEWNATETTYNGKEQKQNVKITNVQKNERNKDYSAGEGIGVVKVSKISYTPGFHFGTEGKDTDEADSTFEGKTGYYTDEGEEEKGLAEGTEISANRTPIDAGTYVMTAVELSDPYNYTLVKIDPESIELAPATIPDTDEPAYVDDHHPIYKIHQYKINKIDWSNTKVTYNASNQKPVVQVNKSDLKGPDTNKEVAVMFHDNKSSEKDNFAGKCNAGTYNLYVLKNDTFRGIKGDRSMNYFIGDTAQKMQEKFTIKKKPLTVTVGNKTGYYGENPSKYKYSVKYAGLINGKVNKDDNHNNKNIPGKYTNDKGVEKNVVEGTLKYTTNYKQWKKYGEYSIKASGLKSDNYDIKYVAGKLNIKNRKLAGDLLAKAKAGNKKATISWTKIYGAAKYEIYFSRCNNDEKKLAPKLYKTVKASKSKIIIKKLKKKKYYKFYVAAINSEGKRITRTPQHHFCTNNVSGKYTNPKTIKPSKKKVKLKKGKTYKLSAKITKCKANKKITPIIHIQQKRYRSGARKVVTVTNSGKIKAVGTGWCRIYVMASNGIWKQIEVTVK